jgi:hypothetical protein
VHRAPMAVKPVVVADVTDINIFLKQVSSKK